MIIAGWAVAPTARSHHGSEMVRVVMPATFQVNSGDSKMASLARRDGRPSKSHVAPVAEQFRKIVRFSNKYLTTVMDDAQ